MKQKLKNYLKLGILLLGISTLLTNCEKDTFDVNQSSINQKESIKISELNYNDLKDNTIFVEEIKRVMQSVKIDKKNSVGIQNRDWEDEDYNFTIDSSNIKQVQLGNYSTYSMFITRDSINPNYFENLVIEIDSSNSSSAYMVKFTPDSETIYFEAHDAFSFSGQIDVNPIDINLLNNRTTTYCYPVSATYCNWPSGADRDRHAAGSRCNNTYTITSSECESYGGGNGPSGGGTGGGGTGGGTDPNEDPDDNSGHDGDDPLVISPVINQNDDDDPCSKLKNRTNTTAYKQKFKDLNKSENFNLDHETGFYEKEVNSQNQLIDGIPGGNSQLVIPVGSLNATHVHNNKPRVSEGGIPYDGAVKIPSPSDLNTLFGIIQLANNPTPENGFFVTISNERIYAISILEPIAFSGLEFSLKWELFKRNYERKSRLIVDGGSSVSNKQDNLKKMFLKELIALDLQDKVGFFEASIEGQNDQNIDNMNISWTRNTLEKVLFGYSVKENDCI